MSDHPPAPGPEQAQPAPAVPQPGQSPEHDAGLEPDIASQRTGFAAAAASNPNRSSGHLGHQYSAQRQLFGDVMRDAVLGDNNFNNTFFLSASDRKSLIHSALSAEAVNEALAFVAPRDFQRVAGFGSTRPLTVVTGAEGSGREAAARYLLAGQSGRQAIHVVHPDTDFALLATQPLPQGVGIVLADVTTRAAASLTEFTLRQLVDALGAAGQRMIVTATPDLPWGCRAVMAHCVALGPPPDPAAVVSALFLRRFGPARQAAARALLGRRDVRELIAARALADRPMKEAALLATLLADAAGDPESMAANAELGMKANAAGEIGDWFENLGDQRQDQYYAIALAVLNGLPNEKVADAGMLLGRLLAPETPERRDDQRGQPFGGNRSRLRRVRAIQVPRDRPQSTDAVGGLVVRYLNRDYPRRLLRHVWEQYDEERGVLTRWLRELGRSALEDVHIGAGVAAAALAMASYEHVFQTIVLPWARSRDIDQQDAAAVSLQTLGEDPRFAARVKSLIEEWSRPDAEVSLRVTAARAYGSRFGAQRIDEAVRVLSGLASIEQWPVTRAIARSLTELVATDTPAVTARVFNLLGEWVSGRSPYLQSTGRLAFLFAAADLVVQVPERVSGQRGAEWPALLRLDLEPGYSPIVRYLWANALNSADLHEPARDVLTAWARSLESNRRGCEALGRMLAGAATTDRTRLILHRLAGQWSGRSSGGGPAPRAAAVLAAVSAS